MKKISLFCCFLFLLVACQHSDNFFNGEYRYQPYSGEVLSVNGEETKFDKLTATGLWIEDTILIVMSHMSSEKLLSAYSLNTQEFLCDLILKGNGPDEYLWMHFVNSYTDETGSKLWVMVTLPVLKLLCIDLTASILEQKMVLYKEIQLDFEDSFQLSWCFPMNDTSLLLLHHRYNNFSLSVGNIETKETIFTSYLFSEDVEREEGTLIWDAFCYNSEKSLLAGGALFFDQINFYPIAQKQLPYSISTNHRKAITYNNFRGNVSRDAEYFYKQPLYYLAGGYYSNNYLMFRYANGQNERGYPLRTQEVLYIFNWTGDLEKIVHLNQALMSIAYDTKNQYLYGVTPDYDIVRFKLLLE